MRLSFTRLKRVVGVSFVPAQNTPSQKDDACTRVQYVLSQRRVFYFYFFFVIANFQDARLRFTFENITRAKPVFTFYIYMRTRIPNTNYLRKETDACAHAKTFAAPGAITR